MLRSFAMAHTRTSRDTAGSVSLLPPSQLGQAVAFGAAERHRLAFGGDAQEELAAFVADSFVCHH